MRAAASDPQGVAKHVLHAVPGLDALRSPEDDELAAAAVPGARFELQSVLVAH
jgi:hypothetical protein